VSLPTGTPSAASQDTEDGSGHRLIAAQTASVEVEELGQAEGGVQPNRPAPLDGGSQGGAPESRAPQGAAPEGAAPEGAAPHTTSGEAVATGGLADADAAGGGAKAGEVPAVGDGGQGNRPAVDGPPSTGDPAVDEALKELPGLLDQPLEAQVDGYAAVHGRLQDRLADLDG
jgi:hypothetical protein